MWAHAHRQGTPGTLRGRWSDGISAITKHRFGRPSLSVGLRTSLMFEGEPWTGGVELPDGFDAELGGRKEYKRLAEGR